MQLTCASKDVLSRLFNDALHRRVRLGQLHQPLHQLGQVNWVIGPHCHPDDRADAELLHTLIVSMLKDGDGSLSSQGTGPLQPAPQCFHTAHPKSAPPNGPSSEWFSG